MNNERPTPCRRRGLHVGGHAGGNGGQVQRERGQQAAVSGATACAACAAVAVRATAATGRRSDVPSCPAARVRLPGGLPQPTMPGLLCSTCAHARTLLTLHPPPPHPACPRCARREDAIRSGPRFVSLEPPPPGCDIGARVRGALACWSRSGPAYAAHASCTGTLPVAAGLRPPPAATCCAAFALRPPFSRPPGCAPQPPLLEPVINFFFFSFSLSPS